MHNCQSNNRSSNIDINSKHQLTHLQPTSSDLGQRNDETSKELPPKKEEVIKSFHDSRVPKGRKDKKTNPSNINKIQQNKSKLLQTIILITEAVQN